MLFNIIKRSTKAISYNKLLNVIDQDWNEDEEFWKEFGGKASVAWIKAPCAAGEDENYWRENREAIALYKFIILIFLI